MGYDRLVRWITQSSSCEGCHTNLQRMASCTSVVLDPSDSVKGAEASSAANAAATAHKLPPSKYKGVVPQPNGR
ncbi:AP2/ERF and B3 domain-containing transcription factor RAV1 [Acorus calamus]|uniref:AP2/ERF and B3 domain-containing transcription factor RAV1 n=1 Tax=Acorus calamus TaxID=4465 RepID=A0AAV9CJG6_ACOCL|nr:AP2/ERF and B3 domain-containing transcription factor RAV1 [Acorus calamus]